MKKFLALLLAVLMIGSVLVACGGSSDSKSKSDDADSDDPLFGEDNVELTVWAADNAQAFTREMCDDFIAQYPDKSIKIDVKTQGEGDVASVVANDPEKAADVFSFACDQMNDLVDRMLLLPVFNDYKDDVIERNNDFTVEAATAKDEDGEDELQAFPETGENGYYLAYDTDVVSDEDAQTLEGVLAACKKAGKKFVLNCGNGFYSCIFPFTGGLACTGRTDDGLQEFNDYSAKKDTILDSLVAFSELLHEYKDIIMDADPARIGSGFAEDPTTVGAGIDGSWNSATVAKTLGDRFGAAKLPTIKIDGKDQQIISVKGCKLIGVNSHTKFPETAQLLANYLTSKEVQQKRLETLSWAPSNQELIDSDEFQNNYKALSALMKQTEAKNDYADSCVSQVNIITQFWGPMATLGKKVLTGDSSRGALEEIFDEVMENLS